ncbi:MAG: hypothetical protein ACFCUE_07535 [Candidatus Bathyarchaeia archaeon]|jgi:HK97 gp10 family phage protein
MSVTVNINVSGAEDFKQAVARFDEAMKRQVQTKLVDWGQTAKATAERLVPVRTGYLKSTLYAKILDWQIIVGANAPYAAPVELGTSMRRAKPYLVPAVQNRLPELQHVINEAINSAKTEAKL